jgi:hypothetical protein
MTAQVEEMETRIRWKGSGSECESFSLMVVGAGAEGKWYLFGGE